MSESQVPNTRSHFIENAQEAAIRIGVVALLIAWCFQIVRPFITPVIWGIIIAVAVAPLYARLERITGGRRRLAALLFVLLALVVLIGPTMMLSETLYGGIRHVAGQLQQGTVEIPPPPDNVHDWPLIGKSLANFWDLASENLEDALGQLKPQIKALGVWLLSSAAGAGFGLLQFVLAIVIAGILLPHGAKGHRTARSVATRFAGTRGEEFINLAETTVRSVARGILGVAVIQSVLAGVGFLVVGIPGAGLLALVCLLLSVIQLGPGLVLIPCVIYVFMTGSMVTGILFLIWNVFVGLLDNVLKPLLLGRGVNVPMIVIFIGAIGGFLSMGIIGLFVGSIVLVLGYTLLQTWLKESGEPVPEGEGPG